ncbi:hypothetical protein F2981_01605 [Sinorhizobium meliloti]|nr:hypothetical protein [Sinorhizobium meliloti]
MSYGDIVARAEKAPAAARHCCYGRFSPANASVKHRNARAQFFRPRRRTRHGAPAPGHPGRDRLRMARHIRIMEHSSGKRLERMIAAGGRWPARSSGFKIKASVFDTPVMGAARPECGLMGCRGHGRDRDRPLFRPDDAADAICAFAEEIAPDPHGSRSTAMSSGFERLYHHKHGAL